MTPPKHAGRDARADAKASASARTPAAATGESGGASSAMDRFGSLLFETRTNLDFPPTPLAP
ncbi:MAG: hypothetical protein QOC89_4030 [Paraburkholderia sp.]|jgi:hypothetical protein|uniref:hypothetical protein n=1 Tax=Paraburkholderia sp. TaxID=1926495 RepID=UPI002AFF8FDD|nr:hypothetical protein [Paraburkholderia sp.]MEA3086333.1 hypothetical protein [Paraburkholderia sp.]